MSHHDVAYFLPSLAWNPRYTVNLCFCGEGPKNLLNHVHTRNLNTRNRSKCERASRIQCEIIDLKSNLRTCLPFRFSQINHSMEHFNYSTHVNVLISNQSRKELASRRTPRAIPSRHLQNYALIKTSAFDINSMMCKNLCSKQQTSGADTQC